MGCFCDGAGESVPGGLSVGKRKVRFGGVVGFWVGLRSGGFGYRLRWERGRDVGGGGLGFGGDGEWAGERADERGAWRGAERHCL